MASAWTEHRSPTGRLYWYNSQTGTSSWERPDDLKTPAERALASTPWKEYQTAEGRKYWHHTVTKETTWTLPDAVREAIEKAAASAPAPAPAPPLSSAPGPVPSQTNQAPPPLNQAPAPMHPTFVPASQTTPAPAQVSPARPAMPVSTMAPGAPAAYTPPVASLPPRPVTSILHSAPASTQPPVPMPDFKTPEDAERAFIGLLRLKGVNPTWTWEQTMRDIITEPLYKALDTLAARKAAWEKFIDNERKREKENREKNIARVRGSWKAGLDSLGDEKTIVDDNGAETKLPGAPPKLWWTWDRLKIEIEKRAPDVWKLCRDDEERKVLWEDYLSELRQRDTMLANQLRGRQQEKLTALLRAHEEKLHLPGELETIQWRTAQEAILQSEEFQQDEDLRRMDDLDILIVFEEEVKRAEKEASELKAKQKDEKRRSCRKTRAAYIQLLNELKLAGEIQAGTMWKEIYSLLEEDERYQNMLGQPGSSPLDLFWDIVDDLNIEIEEKQQIVEALLADCGEAVLETTEFEEFAAWLPTDLTPHKLDQSTLKQVFLVLHDRAYRIAKEEKRRAEKRLRNQIEDLRYALKKLSPPIKIDTPYEEAVDRFSDLQEFKLLEGQDEGRKEAYGRYMERLKEKAVSEDKKNRRKDEEPSRSESKKKNPLQHSDDDDSVISGSKRRRKDLLDDEKYHRHQSPRSNRVEDMHSSPRGGGDHRDERDHDRYRDRERTRGKERDHEKDKDRDLNRKIDITELAREDDVDDDHNNAAVSSRDKLNGHDRPRSKDRNRSKEDRDRLRSRDSRDRANDRADERDRPSSRGQVDDRDRRRKDYESDRHGSRHHRSSRRDREHDDRDGGRRSSRYEDEERPVRDKRPEAPKDDLDVPEKRARSRDRSEVRGKDEPTIKEREAKRPKTAQMEQDKLAEKSDGEEDN